MGKLRIDCCHSQEHADYMSRVRAQRERGADDGSGRIRWSVRPSAFNKSRYHNLISFSSPSVPSSPPLRHSLLTTKAHIDFTVILSRPISGRRASGRAGWEIQPPVRGGLLIKSIFVFRFPRRSLFPLKKHGYGRYMGGKF